MMWTAGVDVSRVLQKEEGVKVADERESNVIESWLDGGDGIL